MKKILNSLLGILLVVLLIYGGISVYSASEASASNTPSGDRPDLKIMRNGSAVNAFQLPNMAPGDSGSLSNRLTNVGSLAGKLGIAFSEVINTPGTSGEYADGSGDLGAKAEIAVYFDADASHNWNSADIGLKSDGSAYPYPAPLAYDTIDNYSSARWKGLVTMFPSAIGDFIVTYRIPITIGNEIQGDSVSFDITFLLEQE